MFVDCNSAQKLIGGCIAPEKHITIATFVHYNLNKLLCNQLVEARSTSAYELESHAIPALNMLLSHMITCP